MGKVAKVTVVPAATFVQSVPRPARGHSTQVRVPSSRISLKRPPGQAQAVESAAVLEVPSGQRVHSVEEAQ